MEDASDWFEMNAHSDAAIRRLESMAVPGLERLPYDVELERLRQRAAQSRWREGLEKCTT